MKGFTYLLLLLIQISLNYGAYPIFKYKCLPWDSECLRARAQFITPILTSGISKLGTEKLDPLYIDCVNIDKDGFKFDFYDIHLNGLKDAIIDKVSIDMHSRVMRLVYHADIILKSQYKTDGYLFSLPIFGQGNIGFRYNNMQVEMIMPFEILKDVHHKEVINLKAYQFWHEARGGGVHSLDNLYFGDKKSSDRMHALLDQHWDFMSAQYGRFLFDKITSKVYNAMRIYLHSQPLENFLQY